MSRLLATAVALSLPLCACLPERDGDRTAPPPTDAAENGSERTNDMRETPPPIAPAEDRAAVARGVNAFTIALYKEAKKPGDFCLSPFSAAMALALVDLGAKGGTKQAIERAVGLSPGPADPHAALGAVLAAAAGGGEPFEQYGEKIPPHELIVANSLWAAQSYALDPAYVAAAERNYAAKVARIDVRDADASAAEINAWVSKKTREKIRDLVTPAAIHELTRLIAVNAVYLKARWREPFTDAATRPAKFFAEDRTTPEVPTMHQMVYHPYFADDAVQVVELPYWSRPGAALSMVLVVPRARDGLAAIEATLTPEKLDGWLSALPTGADMVELALPRWKTETSRTLDDPLRALGLTVMYGAQADFSGISAEEGLHVDTVLQKTFIKVDEHGTEAAAATAVMMAGAGLPPEPKQVLADHPFLYLIRDAESGVVLFIGRVAQAAGG